MTAEQLPLLPEEVLSRAERRVELAVKRDIRHLRAAGELRERAGLVETLLVLARAVDRANRAKDTWAAAAAGREMRQVYALLGSVPEADEFEELIRELSTPVVHAPPA